MLAVIGLCACEIWFYNKYVDTSLQSIWTNRLSLGPHCAVFRMRKLKSQVAKVSTVRV